MRTEPFCGTCHQYKSRSEFYVRTKYADGTPATYRSQCKGCDKARAAKWQKANPDRRREHNRRKWARIKADPESHAFHKARIRENARRANNVSPENYRDERVVATVSRGTAKRLPIGPFTAWLNRTFEDAGEASRATGLDDAAMSRYFSGKQPYVSVDTVDRACLATGDRIDDLYG